MPSKRFPEIFVFFCFFLVTSGADCEGSSPEKLSLEDCVRRAYEVSQTVLSARDAVALSDFRIRDKLRERYPNLKLSVSDARIIDVEEFSYFDPQTGQRYVPGEGYGVSFTAQAPIYTGSKISNSIRNEKAGKKIMELDLSRLQRDIWIDTMTNYIEILKKKGEVLLRKQQLDKSKHSLMEAKLRVSSGSAILYEIHVEESVSAQSELSAMNASNSYNDLLRKFLFNLDYPIEKDVELIDIELPELMDIDINVEMEKSIELREDIARIDNEIIQNRSELSVLRSAGKPSVYLFGTYEKQGNEWSQYSSDDHRYGLGLTVSFSPFPDSSFSYSINRDRINSDDYMNRSYLTYSVFDKSSTVTSEFDLECKHRLLCMKRSKIADEIRIEILAAYDRQNEDYAALETAGLEYRAAKENLDIQDESYRLGLNQINDVIKARTEVNESELKMNNAKYAYLLSRSVLNHAMGYSYLKSSE